mmetsp:Transcript_90247/g.254661  ORF Transcript_90247/g.254661 Transcript_90247/m.254661 type:complete len:516 (-) Transcript_90247:161-1708(-)|eukprot:CAMPEP_0117525520 /NCGR_PEP_ID=MMETSP0784-20121206/35810_1 /TAXON_ID=39447 /ORGANISM="" /LENGTH=515 /DNA_ID=CAMNT_0005321715 /DNA_START=29 /DNA_END=1576 /DNA_ORIENTATION=+
MARASWVLLPHFCVASFVSGLSEGGGFCKGDAPQYTGFLPAGPDAEYFYYLATSRSPHPNKDPVVLWMTGGPGCSSILALLAENGPCHLQGRDAQGDWKLAKNPWSWNQMANVVWVDQPVGVGFSSRGSQMAKNEHEVADRMLTFLQGFYAKYPLYLDVPLFITGESYSGHYIPAVAVRVLRARGSGVGALAGVAIGNGLVDPTIQFASKPAMAFTGGVGSSLDKGVVSKTVYDTMEKQLPLCERGIKLCQQSHFSAECLTAYEYCAVTQVLPVYATGLNPYDLRKQCGTVRNMSDPKSSLCYDTSLETAFLNDPDVKRAIGVPQRRPWEVCNMTTTLPFIISGDELMDYRRSVIELLSGRVHVLVYAGDTDFMVDWLGCRAWVEQLPWAHQQEWAAAPRVDFVLDGQSRGKVQSARGLSFMQVYNAGHMVPMDQPEVSLAMLEEFMAAAQAKNRRGASIFDMTAAHEPNPVATNLVVVAGAAGGVSSIVALVAAARWLPARRHSGDGRSYFLMA